jgi:hypothetical protein
MGSEYRRRRSSPADTVNPAVASDRRAALAGRYVSLYTYLEKRFADTVVLTFAEIEDLLGFALPDLARQREDWWTSPAPDGAPSRFSDAWSLANRTARPNLLALTVVFDRVS